MSDLAALLDEMLVEAEKTLSIRSIFHAAISERIEFVANCLANRAGVRLILSCMLA